MLSAPGPGDAPESSAHRFGEILGAPEHQQRHAGGDLLPLFNQHARHRAGQRCGGALAEALLTDAVVGTTIEPVPDPPMMIGSNCWASTSSTAMTAP